MEILVLAAKRAAGLARLPSWLVGQLRTIRPKTWLVGVLVVYSLLFAAYFTVSETGTLKYAITIGGIVLAAAITETANKEWTVLRVVAICLPVFAVAIVQAHDSYRASLVLQETQLERARERARDLEARVQEELVLDPRDTIEAIQNSDRGFLAKADSLAFQAELKAAQLAPLSDLDRLRKKEISYRNAAGEFRKDVKPLYEKMLSLDERSSEDQREFERRLAEVTGRLAELAARHQIAGLHNHAGLLAMASGQDARALSDFYEALAVEPDHLPVYESLGYALWTLNRDAYGALNLSSAGLKEYLRLRAELDAGMKAISTPGAGEALVKALDDMSVRLKLQYAYFSALQFQNEEQARAYAAGIFASKSSDAEYQDTWGYVLMRFANDSRELEQAIELFRAAIKNPEAERQTKGLAAAHLQQANDLINRLKR